MLYKEANQSVNKFLNHLFVHQIKSLNRVSVFHYLFCFFRREKEESERRSKEEAEKKRLELEEKLRREEEERLARKKRIEEIMARSDLKL
jgi:hypothetical protein